MSFFARFDRLRARGRVVADEHPEVTEPGDGPEVPADARRDADGADGGGADESSGDPADGRGDGDSADGRRVRHPVAARVTTALAAAFVVAALIAPDDATRLTLLAFVRIPVEGLIGVVLVLFLPGRARRVVAALIGAALGVLAIVKLLDLGFSVVLARPFNPDYDWPLFSAGLEFLRTSAGEAGAIGAVVVVALLAVGLLVLAARSVLRLTRVLARHKIATTRTVAALAVAWVAFAVFGVQITPGVPVAGHTYDHSHQVLVGLRDRKEFAKEAAAVDAFRGTPAQNLLTGLHGKDVMLVFVESYGRDAIEDPKFGPQADAVLDAGTRRLAAAGFGARSAFLTSPTAGGGSWLAHSTLLSGLWIDNQQRHDTLMKSDRFTLSQAFRRGGWRTVAVEPGNTRPWPEGSSFYGYERIYDRWNNGYHGPLVDWGTAPDQYTLSAFHRAELTAPHRPPVMAEIPLTSSHAPWVPTPRLIDWKAVGDGSSFGPLAAAGDQREAVWRSLTRIRAAYWGTIEYSLNTLISYVETYGDKNLVMVFLGDHQPTPLVTGPGADRDVPITIVARDKAVLDRISGWGWQDGLRPDPHAPVWRMNAFRDRFLTAFGPQPQPTRTSALPAH
ncbi:sulfatase [Actinoallomurus purpureus]|uniref:sulfatase-like hydrolase/transferase n=1 Tax=Actinoallomurus purpureus TaxID=478114 RepID=UPI002093D1C6|nr:sulfatase-like hydrolase/transferase [Actinoallomurus purpureus]MCO6003613.1 sulfatase [Actinoallomurus purpureus]